MLPRDADVVAKSQARETCSASEVDTLRRTGLEGIFHVLALFSPAQDAGARLHPTRAQILRLVAENPGIPVSRLRHRIPLGWGTLYHHVWKLCEARELVTVVLGRRRLLYLPGAATEEATRARNILEGKTANAIARIVLQSPRLSFKELVRLSGGSERSVYYHLKRLLDAGLVVSTSRTRYYGLVASPMLALYLSQVDADREGDGRAGVGPPLG